MEHLSKTAREYTHTDRLLNLARQKGLLRSSDLDALGVPRMYT